MSVCREKNNITREPPIYVSPWRVDSSELKLLKEHPTQSVLLTPSVSLKEESNLPWAGAPAASGGSTDSGIPA